MTDLQFLLLALGVVIIVAVMLFNWWQEKKFFEASQEQFGVPQRDALMDDFRIDTEAISKDKPLPESAIHANKTTPDLKSEDVDKGISLATAISEPDYQGVDDIQAGFTHGSLELAKQSREEVADSGIVVDWDEGEGQGVVEETTELNVLTQPLVKVGNSATEHQSGLVLSLPEAFFPQIDLTALIFLAQPSLGIDIRSTMAKLPDHNKLVRIYALNQDHHWFLLTNEQNATEFSCIACGLQLADRAGPVIKDTLERFQRAVNEAGDTLHARVEWQSDIDLLQYANELDAFCIGVDKTVGFHVVQGVNGPYTGTKFRGLAEAGGLRLAEDGAFHYVNEDGQKLFSVINQDSYPFSSEMLRTSVIYRITFQLDVARVKNSIEAFNQMVLIARQMVIGLNAIVVDDNQRSLSDEQLDKIRQQLKVIHAEMTTHGIIPGSACALRLFS
jgi:FtsZ-interacting cell division protein ZipA